MRYSKICPKCQKSFVAPHQRVYCSNLCRLGSVHASKPCLTCQTTFVPRNRNAKYCSIMCRPTDYAVKTKNTEPTVYPTTLCSVTIGAIGELTVCADLMRKGFNVFRAVSPACYCDLIATHGPTTLVIEVRTGTHQRGRFIFPKKRLGTTINCVAMWERHSGAIFYLHPVTHEILSVE
jgi:hypothetical protein